MGSRGIYLNKWTLDFSPKNGIPFVILVWVIFPFLPLHFQNEETMIAIGNALEEYINRVGPKHGLQYYAGTCVEVDLEKGLLKSINLTLDNSSYIQPFNYE